MLSHRLQRMDRWGYAFALLCVGAVLGLLVYGRGMTFFFDEWSFIWGRSDWTLADLFKPHNEHWSLVPVLIHKILMNTVGLRTYAPYQLVLLVLHAATAVALFAIVRFDAGRLVAFLAGALFLFFGKGDSNLMWAALIGWNAAMAAGGWALALAIVRPRAWWPIGTAVLLLVAVASSAIGVAFGGAVALVCLLRNDLRRMWVIVPAAASFGTWFVLFGAQNLQLTEARNSDITLLPHYIATSFSSTVGAVSGWGALAAAPLAVLLIAATAARAVSPRPLRLTIVVGLVGALGMLGMVLLGRTGMEVAAASTPRYVYAAAFFLIIVFTGWMAELGFDVRNRRAVLAVVGLFTIALTTNLVSLRAAHGIYLGHAANVRANLTVLLAYGGSVAVPANQGIFPIPGRAALEAIFARYGSPIDDELGGSRAPTPPELDAALFRLVGGRFRAFSNEPMPADGVAPAVVTSSNVLVTADGECLELNSTGADPQVVVQVASGQALFAQATGPEGAGEAFLAKYDLDFRADRSVAVSLSTANATAIAPPDVGAGEQWRIRFDPGVTPTRLCLAVFGAPAT